jgi:hypothetical protein
MPLNDKDSSYWAVTADAGTFGEHLILTAGSDQPAVIEADDQEVFAALTRHFEKEWGDIAPFLVRPYLRDVAHALKSQGMRVVKPT